MEDRVIALERLLDIEPAEIGSLVSVEKGRSSEEHTTLHTTSVETYGALENHSVADKIFLEYSVRVLLITTIELPAKGAPGKIDRLLKLAIPEIYGI